MRLGIVPGAAFGGCANILGAGGIVIVTPVGCGNIAGGMVLGYPIFTGGGPVGTPTCGTSCPATTPCGGGGGMDALCGGGGGAPIPAGGGGARPMLMATMRWGKANQQ